MEIKCNLCNKYFTEKRSLKYHLDNNVCKNKELVATGEYACIKCGKIFGHKNNMYRHMKHSCSVIKEQKKNDEIKVKEQKEKDDLILKEIKELKEKIVELEKIGGNKTTNNIGIQNNNNTINNNNNIIIIAHGKERPEEVLTDEEIKKIVSAGFSAPLEYIKTVHFNKRIPELKNIYKFMCSCHKTSYIWTFSSRSFS